MQGGHDIRDGGGDGNGSDGGFCGGCNDACTAGEKNVRQRFTEISLYENALGGIRSFYPSVTSASAPS